jgi:hypothetical protein
MRGRSGLAWRDSAAVFIHGTGASEKWKKTIVSANGGNSIFIAGAMAANFRGGNSLAQPKP